MNRIRAMLLSAGALAALSFTATPAHAGAWDAQWRSTYSPTKVFMAAPNTPVCRIKPVLDTSTQPYKYKPETLFVGAAHGRGAHWTCGGKTGNEIQFLSLKDSYGRNYKRVGYSSSQRRIASDTLIDDEADRGLCIARVVTSGSTQHVPGYVYRGEEKCTVKMLGRSVKMSKFDFITPRNTSFSYNNEWRTKQNTTLLTQFRVGVDNAQSSLDKDAYLCRAKYAGKDYFGTTFTGAPPNRSSGDYCKITYRSASGASASHKYVSAYSVYLNTRPSRQGGAVFAGATFNGNIMRPQPGTAVCRRGSVLGMKFNGENTCRYPTTASGATRYLFTRK